MPLLAYFRLSGSLCTQAMREWDMGVRQPVVIRIHHHCLHYGYNDQRFDRSLSVANRALYYCRD